MPKHMKAAPSLGAKQACNEFVQFLRESENQLFETDRESDLESSVKALKLTGSILGMPSFPSEQIYSLANEYALDELTIQRLRIVSLLLKAQYNKQVSSNSESDEAEEEESEETDDENTNAEDDSADEEEDNSEKIIEYLKNNYTYRPEIVNLYHIYVFGSKKLGKIHDTTVETTQKANETWEKTKEKIKSVLSLFGVEGLFVAVDYAAKKNKIVKHSLKMIGTTILPILILVYLFVQIARWTANPIQKILKWLAKELDIKLPTEDEDAVGG